MNLQRWLLAMGLLQTLGCAHSPNPADPYLWLEDSHSEQTKNWVKLHNLKSTEVLKYSPHYNKIAEAIRPLLTAKERIPYPKISNGRYTNFWQDEKNLRGVWRTTTFSDYEKLNPSWRILLSIDQLNHSENKSWVFAGAECLHPEDELCLLSLSDGGKDEVTVREFNTRTRTFVKNGFVVPAAKSQISWVNRDTLLIGSNFGPNTLTTSGYPKQIRLWHRGTKLNSSKLIFEAQNTDVNVSAFKNIRPESQHQFIERAVSYFDSEIYVLDPQYMPQRIPLATSAQYLGDFKNFVLFRLREDFKTNQRSYSAGSVVSIPIESATKPDFANSIEILFEPDERSTFLDLNTSKNYIFLSLLRNVRSEMQKIEHTKSDWISEKIVFPDGGIAAISDSSSFSDRFLATFQGFTNPPALYAGDASVAQSHLRKIKELPAQYNATDIVTEQFESTSKDGTQIPYFVVHKKNMKFDGQNPTLQTGYGGFEGSVTPTYLNSIGKIWIEKGGVYVLTNIRGGGEFGPRWHKAALKEHRQRAYDDFWSITQDLFKKKITSPDKMGIQGGSNGGLLVAVTMIQHPEDYKAVICESALLDMLRYHKLPPGASWMGEYGDPDLPEMAKIIAQYSPYQNIRKGIHYPKVFFHTSTADDRVLPGHTRKMVARLEEKGHDLLMHENTEGGHSGAADIQQRIEKISLQYTYLYNQLTTW